MDNYAKKILWKCRRGSLELDLILSRFFENKFLNLSIEDQQIFEQLLDEQDPLLTSWIFSDEKPSREDFVRLIQIIKSK